MPNISADAQFALVALRDLVGGSRGSDEAMAILQEFGASTLVSLDPSCYGAVIERARQRTHELANAK